MDGYHKVKDGVKYPAILLTHGINDPHVRPLMSAKFAARLQAAATSQFPVLLRLDYDAGHGIGSSRSQMIAEPEVMGWSYIRVGSRFVDPKSSPRTRAKTLVHVLATISSLKERQSSRIL